jgi:uncharacterized delta-60 repeat protein
MLAFGLVSAAAPAATGDLDAGFADVGRLVLPDFLGPGSFVAAPNDGILLAGGKIVHDFNSRLDDEAFGFARRVSSTGTLDPTYAAPGLDGISVIAAELQSDGKIIGVGGRSSDRGIRPVAFRLESDGSLDATFGTDGVVGLPFSEVRSVAADPGGTIVVAGMSFGDMPRSSLDIMRLLETGEADGSFGTAGVFVVSPDTEQNLVPARILSAEGGGYRIAYTDSGYGRPTRCRVLALTASGTPEEAFGEHGYAEAGTWAVSACRSMVELLDGRLLVGGTADSRPFLVRLHANGSVDPTFETEQLTEPSLSEATDIAVDPNDGSIIVVLDGTLQGLGEPGVAVARLRPDGDLDEGFGGGGVTWVDFPETSGKATFAGPGDVTVLANSDVLVSGGADTAVVARLVGGSGRDSPGVMGVRNYRVRTTEADQQVTVTVRRMGGKSGSVSLAYETHAGPADVFHATEGQDFSAVSGRLQWADGDVGDRQFVIPIAPDDGSLEESERFAVQLSDIQGGAGAGTLETTVLISSDAPPGGMFAIETPEIHVDESGVVAFVSISRDYHYKGAVSVTVTPVSGTATAYEDFSGDGFVLSWGNGDKGKKLIEIPIYDDLGDEPQEVFSLQLSDATGGAVIGPRGTAAVLIADDDPTPPGPPPRPPGGGGGGGDAAFAALLLGLVGLLRVERRRGRRR